MNIQQFRQRFPQYDNLSDFDLTRRLHEKYYPQLELLDFSERFGVPPSLMRPPTILAGASPGPPDTALPVTPRPQEGDVPAPIDAPIGIGDVVADPVIQGISEGYPLGQMRPMDPIETQGITLPLPGRPTVKFHFDPFSGEFRMGEPPADPSLLPVPEELDLGLSPKPLETAEPRVTAEMVPGEEESPLLAAMREAFAGELDDPEAIIAAQARRAGMAPQQYKEETVKPSGGLLERGIGDIAAGGLGVAQGMTADVGRRMDSPALEHAALKMGEKAQSLIPADPTYIDKLLSGAGSMASFFVPGMGLARGVNAVSRVSPVMSTWLGAGAAAGMEASAEAGFAYSEAIAEGKSPDQADAIADDVFWKNAALVGATNKMGLFREGQAGIRRALTAAVEGGQEAGQELIAGGTIPEALEAGSIGALLGGAMAGSMKTPQQALGDQFAQAIEDSEFVAPPGQVAAESLQPQEEMNFPRVQAQPEQRQPGDYGQAAIPPDTARYQPPTPPKPEPEPMPARPTPQAIENRYRKAAAVKDTDSLITQVAKLGGIARAEAEAQGIDPADFKTARWGIHRAFNNGKRAQSFDGMAEQLRQYGWRFEGPNDLLEAMYNELRGVPQYTDEGIMQFADKREREDVIPPDEYTGDMYEPVMPDGSATYPAGLDEDGRTLLELYAEAKQINPEQADAVFQSSASDAAVAQGLYDIIRGGQYGQRRGTQEVDTGGRREVPAKPPVAETPSGATPDIFGDRDETAQAIRDRELERERKIAGSPPVESGEGNLFSGGDRQTDIEDVAGRPAQTAFDRFQKAQEAYRRGEIGDDEYLAARREYEGDREQFERDRGELQPDKAIPEAGFKIAGRWNTRVSIADLRKKFRNLDREIFDAVLIDLANRNQAALYPIEDPREMTQAHRDAALSYGGEPVHYVYFEPQEVAGAKQKPETGRKDGGVLSQPREDEGQVPTEKGGVRVQPGGQQTRGPVREGGATEPQGIEDFTEWTKARGLEWSEVSRLANEDPEGYRELRRQFEDQRPGAQPEPERKRPKATPPKGGAQEKPTLTRIQEKKVNKFRELADKQDEKAEQKENPAVAEQNYTARRARIARGMAADAEVLRRNARILRGIADAIEAGTLPANLENFNSLADIERIYRGRGGPESWSRSDHVGRDLLESAKGIRGIKEARDYLNSMSGPLNATFVGHMETVIRAVKKAGKQSYWIKEAQERVTDFKAAKRLGIKTEDDWQKVKVALDQYANKGKAVYSLEEQEKRRRRRELEEKAQEIRGGDLFPTPPSMANRMVEAADIGSEMRVLEPSAGKGAIADTIMQAHPDAEVQVVELNSTLADLLDDKGFITERRDFLDYKPGAVFDRVLMNPPFSKNQDIDHVRHAYDLTKPGGRIVALMSEHAFFAGGNKETEFRDWLETVGTSEELDPGALADKKQAQRSNVKARLVTIDKPAKVAKQGKQGKPLNQIKIVQEAQVEGTGERVKYSQTADVALSTLDSRIDALENLRDCLRS